jgi:hypothetical protein
MASKRQYQLYGQGRFAFALLGACPRISANRSLTPG